MSELIYTSDDIKKSIIDFNSLSIIDFLNYYIKKMFDEQLHTIQIPVDRFSKNDIMFAKSKLKDFGFKTVLVPDGDGFINYIMVIVI